MLNVLSADTDQLDLQLGASVKSDLTVNTLLEGVVWILFNSVPLNNSWVNFVNDLQKDLTVSHVFVKIVDVNILDF